MPSRTLRGRLRRISRRSLLASALGLALPVRFSWAAPGAASPAPAPSPWASAVPESMVKLLGAERWSALARLANHFLPGISDRRPTGTRPPARSARASRFSGTSLPSATEVGALDYLARALDGPYRPQVEAYRIVLDSILESVRAGGGSIQTVDDASLASILERLRAASAGPALDTIRGHVLEGCFALPVHGGNRKEAGWKAVGLVRHQHADE